MPIGPGDDVLDAIEAGKGDDVLMKDYKLNSDQVKSFRSLYYGLTKGNMKYDDIKDYYPELKTYFAGPTLQQTPEASVIPKEDFTKPVKQTTVAESTAHTATQPVKTGQVNQDILNNKLKTAKQTLQNTLTGYDDVLQNMIRTHRYEQAKQQDEERLAQAPRSDMPAAAMLADINEQIEPRIKPQDIPVTPEDIGKLRNEVQTNEPQAP